jgi:hypothetical protein
MRGQGSVGPQCRRVCEPRGQFFAAHKGPVGMALPAWRAQPVAGVASQLAAAGADLWWLFRRSQPRARSAPARRVPQIAGFGTARAELLAREPLSTAATSHTQPVSNAAHRTTAIGAPAGAYLAPAGSGGQNPVLAAPRAGCTGDLFPQPPTALAAVLTADDSDRGTAVDATAYSPAACHENPHGVAARLATMTGPAPGVDRLRVHRGRLW